MNIDIGKMFIDRLDYMCLLQQTNYVEGIV